MLGVIRSSGATRDESEAISPWPSSGILRSVPTWIALAILCTASVGEISHRAEIGSLPLGIFHYSKIQATSISAEEMSGELLIATIYVLAVTDHARETSVIRFGYSCSAATEHFEIALIMPDGTKAWSEQWQGIDISVDSLARSVQADTEGEWLLTVIGKATKLTIADK